MSDTERRAGKRLAWVTDPHLNFVEDDRISLLIQELHASGADAVLVGGDIGEADSFAAYLERLSSECPAPIYFVLGNHDYYQGSISDVRREARALSDRSSRLGWLPAREVVQLTDDSALVGHGGWGDGRSGSFLESEVALNDYMLIAELRETHGFPHTDRLLTRRLMKKLNDLGDEAAAHFRKVLPEALATSRNVLVLMHVPPFREACWHEGKLSDKNWAPHFVCEAAGEVLKDFMRKEPQKHMTVLCGHTHGSGHAQVLENLEALTGAARYGEPRLQQIVEIA